jgi:hypothetical protein
LRVLDSGMTHAKAFVGSIKAIEARHDGVPAV